MHNARPLNELLCYKPSLRYELIDLQKVIVSHKLNKAENDLGVSLNNI